jgi:FlaA1/EpsC-like NDP-sugar epimerase
MLSSCSSRFLPPLTVRVAVGASTCRGLSRTTTTRRCGSNHRRASSSTTPPTAARVVVVGAGRMGRIRADLLRANPRFAVVGLVDARLDQARAVADRYGVRTVLYCVCRSLVAR